jgi:hypothetical protein
MYVSHDVTDSPDYQVVNTSFPHIGRKIKSHWGQPEFNALIHQLLRDKRGGTREGFPAQVDLALAHIEKQHEREFPELVIPPASMWDLNNYL